MRVCIFLSTPSARRATDAPLIWATSLMYFYPRPLRGGRQPSVSAPGCNYIFLSTPSARRATHELDHGQRAQVISIHALCEEGDVDRADVPEGVVISIHALCEEGDGAGLLLSTCKQLFLSTPSARRATRSSRNRSPAPRHFYPRPLRGGRLPLRARCKTAKKFLSTPSARRATERRRHRCRHGHISIHALCEEGDTWTT